MGIALALFANALSALGLVQSRPSCGMRLLCDGYMEAWCNGAHGAFRDSGANPDASTISIDACSNLNGRRFVWREEASSFL